MWSMNFPSTASCTIRKIFNLRQKVQVWITKVVGNGLDTFLWYHNWHPFGPLKDWFGDRLAFKTCPAASQIQKNGTDRCR